MMRHADMWAFIAKLKADGFDAVGLSMFADWWQEKDGDADTTAILREWSTTGVITSILNRALPESSYATSIYGLGAFVRWLAARPGPAPLPICHHLRKRPHFVLATHIVYIQHNSRRCAASLETYRMLQRFVAA